MQFLIFSAFFKAVYRCSHAAGLSLIIGSIGTVVITDLDARSEL